MTSVTFLPTLPSFAACLLGGGGAGLWIACRRLAEARLRCRDSIAVLFLGGFGGVLGGSFSGGAAAGEGSSLLGGLVAFALSIAACSRFARLPVLETLDVAMPSALLGLSIARLGCLFAGCCFGPPADIGWTYPAGTPAFAAQQALGLVAPDAPESKPTLPYPILDSLSLLAVFLAASVLWRRGPRSGATAALCGAYAGWRLLSDSLRGDLSTSQALSLLALALSATAAALGGSRTGLAPGSGGPTYRPLAPSLALAATFLLALGSLACGSKGDMAVAQDCAGACLKAGFFSKVHAGRRYEAALVFETKIDGRRTASGRAEGTFTLADVGNDGAIRVRGSIRSISLDAGRRVVEGSGGIEALLQPEGILLRPLLLDDALCSALKALEPFTAGAIRIEGGARPDLLLREEIRSWIPEGGARSETRGVLTIAGVRQPFRLDARVSRDPTEGSGLSALLSIESPGRTLIVQTERGRVEIFPAPAERDPAAIDGRSAR